MNRLKKVTDAISSAVSWVYDKVAVSKQTVFENANRHYELTLTDWPEYQKQAPFRVMDEIADAYIFHCKVEVSGLGVLMGFGGFVTMAPDVGQFLALTLRMVTGIAAAYGFDPDPNFLEGRVKAIILQAYLNANIGQTGAKTGERVGVSAAVKFFRNVAMRTNRLTVLIVKIAQVLGFRMTRQGLLRSIPIVASGANAGFNWYLTYRIGADTREEFRQFRKDLRSGKYRDDSDYDGL